MKNDQSIANAKPTAAEILDHCQAMLGDSVASEELLELTMQLLAQELFTAKLQGKAISDNLKLLGYLMRFASLKLRAAAQRLREQKAAAKPTTTTQARPEKPASPPAVLTVTRPPLEDDTYLKSILEQYGHLPKQRPPHPTNKFRINPDLLDLSFLDELPTMMAKAAA